MDYQNDMFRRAVPTLPPPPLPADLVKLRDRYLHEFPDSAVETSLLAYVPAALRHLLTLRLELHRAETLPARYRDTALAALGRGPVCGDAVDQMVGNYAQAIRDADTAAASTLRRDLRRYFTESQIVELALLLSMSLAFETFEAALTER